LLIGHNILTWDIPILQKYTPALKDLPPVWDTLLVSYLLDPGKSTYALGGSHDAESDAKKAFSLFKEQARRLGVPAVMGLIRRPVAPSGG
jgi:hypothetical protein